jgi:DNA-binding response OmpR family regulator
VLDVRKPGMDGLSLQRRLAETGQTVPIIFLSARASEEERHTALATGRRAFCTSRSARRHSCRPSALRWRNRPLLPRSRSGAGGPVSPRSPPYRKSGGGQSRRRR